MKRFLAAAAIVGVMAVGSPAIAQTARQENTTFADFQRLWLVHHNYAIPDSLKPTAVSIAHKYCEYRWAGGSRMDWLDLVVKSAQNAQDESNIDRDFMTQFYIAAGVAGAMNYCPEYLDPDN